MSEVFKVGDRVRTIDVVAGLPIGSIGVICETERESIYPTLVDFPEEPDVPVKLDEIELVDPSSIVVIPETVLAEAGGTASDAVEHPNYYVLPNGRETIEISQWLTSAGGQAVQYIVRATRIDGVHKGERVQDIDKAIYWLNVERERLVSQGE